MLTKTKILRWNYFVLTQKGANLIKSLGPGEFRVNDVLYTRSIIVTADKVVDAWTQNSAQDPYH